MPLGSYSAASAFWAPKHYYQRCYLQKPAGLLWETAEHRIIKLWVELLLGEIINCRDVDKRRDERREAGRSEAGHKGPLKSASKGSDLLSRPLRSVTKITENYTLLSARDCLTGSLSSAVSGPPQPRDRGRPPAWLSRPSEVWPILPRRTASCQPHKLPYDSAPRP